ncbi:MAG: GOLPH3/VPS74 family protein [Pirellulaceae bacterium]
MNKPLFLHQEVMLLSLRDEKGTAVGGFYTYAIAGAMLSELLMQQRLLCNDDKQRTVAVISEKPTGDELLDELVGMILESSKPRGLQHWVGKAASIKDLHHRLAQGLCKLGILKHEQDKVLWIFTRQVYPEIDPTCENEIRERMASVMFHDDVKPDHRTAVLIALASHASLLSYNFDKSLLKQHRERIKQIANGELQAAGATKEAIAAMQAAIIAATTATTVAATISASN